MSAAISERRARELLWHRLRLVVVDVETLFDQGDFSGEGRIDVERAIEQVRLTGQPLRLAPQTRAVRRRQHAAIEAAGLASTSHGDEPERSVEVEPRPDGLDEPPSPVLVPGGEHRAISVAAVSCARGRVGRVWHRLVNPGVSVDSFTTTIHGLTDRHLRKAPAFPAIAPDLLGLLTAAEDEMLVLVAHNAGFDVGVLRAEFRRAGLALPDLPVLDTMGPLAARVGVKPVGASLSALLDSLGLTNDFPHRADADARATAAAVCALLDRAVRDGQSDIAGLLADLGHGTTATIRSNRPGPGKPTRPQRSMPGDHVAAHVVLSGAPNQEELRRWIALADDCARLRCPDLGRDSSSLVATALAPPDVLLDGLVQVVESRAAAGDGSGVATAIDAVGQVFDLTCPVPMDPTVPARQRYPIGRQEAIALWQRVAPMVAGAARCEADPCPACWEGRPCPRDELARRMAPAVLGPVWERGTMLKGFSVSAWLPSGDRKTGWLYHRQEAPAYSPNRLRAGAELADAVVGFLLRAYRVHGEEADAPIRVLFHLNRVMRIGGCGDPTVWEMWAWEQARGGRAGDLRAAIRACVRGLEQRPLETTASAWASLELTMDHLRVRLSHLERGTETRHHPGPGARRTRPLRFAVR